MSDSANTWWTPARARAFELVVADRITDEDIAREVGICRKTLFNWRQPPTLSGADGGGSGGICAAIARRRGADRDRKVPITSPVFDLAHAKGGWELPKTRQKETGICRLEGHGAYTNREKRKFCGHSRARGLHKMPHNKAGFSPRARGWDYTKPLENLRLVAVLGKNGLHKMSKNVETKPVQNQYRSTSEGRESQWINGQTRYNDR